jgi:hypothetical protein
MKEARAIGEKGLLALICSLLMAFQPVFGAPSALPIGTVNGKGPIRLNGLPAAAGTTVYAGNRITTGPAAAGYVTLAHGGKLVLGGSTLARIQTAPGGEGISVMLDRGVVGAVSDAKTPIVVEAGGVTIRTKQASGAYEVELSGNKLRVLARHGTTLAAASNRTVEVSEGKLMTANVGSTPQTSSNSHKREAVLVLLTGVAVAGAGLGVALAYPGKTCQAVSPSGFTCR